VPWIGLELTSLDALDDASQHIVGAVNKKGWVFNRMTKPSDIHIVTRLPLKAKRGVVGRPFDAA
jgi:hypothetical protein